MQLSASAIYQLAVAPVVSDYTRYLPKKTAGLRVSGVVFLGTVTSALWLEALGAYLATALPGTDSVGLLQLSYEDAANYRLVPNSDFRLPWR